jgi:hypothetical protein
LQGACGLGLSGKVSPSMTPQASSSSFATVEHEPFIVCLPFFDVFIRAVAVQLHTIGDDHDLLQSSPLFPVQS